VVLFLVTLAAPFQVPEPQRPGMALLLVVFVVEHGLLGTRHFRVVLVGLVVFMSVFPFVQAYQLDLTGRATPHGVFFALSWLVMPVLVLSLCFSLRTTILGTAAMCLEKLLDDAPPPPPCAALAQGGQPAKAPKSSAPRMLLVEDQPVNQRTFLRMLRRLGHDAQIAGNGREALDVAGQQPFDLIFMDIQMPELDGLEATRALRARVDAPRPVVIGVTAAAFEEDVAACMASGMDAVLTKPFGLAELRTMLGKWL